MEDVKNVRFLMLTYLQYLKYITMYVLCFKLDSFGGFSTVNIHFLNNIKIIYFLTVKSCTFIFFIYLIENVAFPVNNQRKIEIDCDFYYSKICAAKLSLGVYMLEGTSKNQRISNTLGHY